MPTTTRLLRTRSEHGRAKVTFIELFFDLVFVYAITQLSHLLIAHFTPLGAFETLLLLLAVWWVWIFTSWVTNWLDPEKLPVRLALMVMMGFGLILSASIPKAFESRGFAFAAAYVAMQVGRSLFFIWAVRGHPGMMRNFQRILIWLTFTGAIWMAGGCTEGWTRLGLWSLALAIEYLAPSVYFWVPILGPSRLEDWNVAGGHLAERCAGFIIIALGESVLVTGVKFSELVWTPITIWAFVVSLTGSIAMWWLYFDTMAAVASERIAKSRNPGRLARLAYTYIHLFMVAGIVVSAVSDEFVLHHPGGSADPKVTITVLLGTALYLAGNLLFKRVIVGRTPMSHLAGLLALGALVPAANYLSPVTLSAAAAAVLIAIAAWERKTWDSGLPRAALP